MIVLLLLLAGLLAQFVDGTLGMGYGVSSASMLVAVGLAPAVVSASVHTAEIVTTLLSGVFHLRFGNVRKDLILPLAIPGVVGGIAGACFLSSVPGKAMTPWVAGILLVMGCLMVCQCLFRMDWGAAIKSKLGMIPFGFVAAFIDAVGGGGWGPILTPSLILAGGEEPRKAVGTVDLSEFFVTVAEAVTFALVLGPKTFRWDIVAFLLIGGVAAAPLAAWTCSRLPHRTLGVAVGVLLILLNGRTLLL